MAKANYLTPELDDFIRDKDEETVGRLARSIGRNLRGAVRNKRKIVNIRCFLAECRDQLTTESPARLVFIAMSELCSGYLSGIESEEYRKVIRATKANPNSIQLWKLLGPDVLRLRHGLTPHQIAKHLGLSKEMTLDLLTRNCYVNLVEHDRKRFRLSLSGLAALSESQRVKKNKTSR